MNVGGRIAIRLRVDPVTLGGSWPEIESGFSAALTQIWNDAAREPVRDGRAAGARVGRVSIAWRGALAGAVAQPQRQQVEARLRELLAKLGASTKPVLPKEQISAWVGQPVEFLALFGDLLAMMATSRLALAGDRVDALRLRYADLLDQRTGAVAWVVEVTRPLRWSSLARDLLAQNTERFGKSGAYFYIWDAARRDALVALDKAHLSSQIPKLIAPVRQPAIGEDFDVERGTRIVFVGFALPELAIEDIAWLGEPIELALPLASFLRRSESFDPDDRGWLHESQLAERMGADPAPFEGLRDAWPAWPLKVRIQPLRPRRKASISALRQLLQERALEVDRFADQTGELIALGRKVDGWPPEIERVLKRLAADLAPPPADVDDATYWPAGSLGAFVFPLVDRVVMELVHSIPRRAAVATSWLPKAEAILRQPEGKDRDQALGEFIDMITPNGPLFEQFLDGLESAGLLTRFFDTVRTADGWYYGLRDQRGTKVTGSAVQTRHLHHPALAALIESLRFHGFADSIITDPNATFDLANQFIDLPGSGKRVYAKGTSSDDARGVLAEASGNFYSEKSKVSRLKPEVMTRLREPTRKKVGDIVRRMACEPGETRTEKELMAQALKLAMDELGISDEHAFEPVTMRMSHRVLALQEPVISGVPKLRILVEPVFKIGDEPWQSGGRAELMDPGHFQNVLLTNYLVNRMVEALTVFVMASAALATGVFIVVAGIVGVGELLLWISISEVMYLFTTDRSEWSIEGVIGTALMAELQAVGFKGLQFAAAPLKLGVGKLITGRWIGEAATKWIAFGLRSTITATEFGALGTMDLFANELFHMTRCRGLSSAEVYAERFRTGFKLGLLFEFAGPAVGPLLQRVPGLGGVLRRATTYLEVTAQLRQSGLGYGEIAGVLLKGRQALEETLAAKLDNPEVAQAIAAMARRSSSEVLDTLWTELRGSYRKKAYEALFEQLGQDLGKDAAGGLGRMLSTSGEDAVNALLADLRRTGTDPRPLLNALGVMDEASAKLLITADRLPLFARSPNVQELFTLNRGAIGIQLLEGPFKGSLTDLETFLVHVRALPAKRSQAVLKALLDHEPLPPSVLLAAAREGELDAAALERLYEQADASLAPRALRGTRAELLPEPSGRYLPAKAGSKTIGAPHKSLREAVALYDEVIAQTAGRLEVGIWRNEAGEYVVRLGQRGEVDAPAAWRAVRHYHTNLPDIALWRMPARADVEELARRVGGTGEAATEIVEYPLPDGRRGRAAYTVHGDGSVTIEFTDAAGRRLPPKKFDSVRDYENYYESHKVYADPATAKALVEDWEAGRTPADPDVDIDAFSPRTATGASRRRLTAAERELSANEKKLPADLLAKLKAERPPAYLYRQLLADGKGTVRRYVAGDQAERAALRRKMRLRDDSERGLRRDRPLSRPRDELGEQLPPRDPGVDDLLDDPSLGDIVERADRPQGSFQRGEAALIGTLEEAAEVAEFRPVLNGMGYGATVYKTQFRSLEWLDGVYQGNRVPDFVAIDASGRRLLVGDTTSSLQTTIPNEFGPGERLHFDKTVEHAEQLLRALRGRADFAGWLVQAMDVVRSSTQQMQPKLVGRVQP